MEKQKIQDLILRFHTGEATEGEKKELEHLIEAGVVSLKNFESLQKVEHQLQALATPAPSSKLDDRFYKMLASAKETRQSFSWKQFFSWPEFAPKLAFASFTLILGLVGGYLLRTPVVGPGSQIEALSKQVSDLQEMMMLSLLEKESATDRLKAVNLTQGMSEASLKVTNALIQTLNEDDNVNVRLAALEALTPFVRDNKVREALVRSIAKQESPLVQLSMAELMVALHEKTALQEFEKIVGSEKTPAEVKEKIRQTIEVLI